MTYTLKKLVRPIFTDNYWVWPALTAALIASLAVWLPHFAPFDAAIIHAVKSLPKNLKPLMEALSNLASVPTTIIIVLAWLAFLCIFRRWKFAVTMLVSMLTVPLYGGIKTLVKRTRPDPSIIVQFGFHNDSFPSGHAAASAIVYLMIAYIAQKSLSRGWSIVVNLAAVMLTLAVGISRVYLGFHFPTDVIAGWLVAVFVFLIVTRAADGRIESDTAKKP